MTQDKKYYEIRVKYLVKACFNKELSLEKIAENRERIMLLKEDYQKNLEQPAGDIYLMFLNKMLGVK